jgi:hypothetical protein
MGMQKQYYSLGKRSRTAAQANAAGATVNRGTAALLKMRMICGFSNTDAECVIKCSTERTRATTQLALRAMQLHKLCGGYTLQWQRTRDSNGRLDT